MEWIHRFIKEIRLFGLEKYGRFYGTYKGFVSDTADPEMRGRIKVECPYVYGQDVYDYWALPRGMYSGEGRGFFALPKAGDPIWVTFEGGNPKVPLWEYGYFGKDDLPKKAKDDYPDVHVWQYNDNRYELDGKNNVLRIVGKDGKVFELNKDGLSLGSQDKSAEPATLGQTNVDVLTDISTELDKLNTEVINLTAALQAFVTTQGGVASAVVFLSPLAPAYSTLAGTLTTIGGKLPPITTKLQQLIQTEIEKTKSKIVTLD